MLSNLPRQFLNFLSKCLAFILSTMSEEDYQKAITEDKTKIASWIDFCRKEDALDGVVEIRKVIEDDFN